MDGGKSSSPAHFSVPSPPPPRPPPLPLLFFFLQLPRRASALSIPPYDPSLSSAPISTYIDDPLSLGLLLPSRVCLTSSSFLSPSLPRLSPYLPQVGFLIGVVPPFIRHRYLAKKAFASGFPTLAPSILRTFVAVPVSAVLGAFVCFNVHGVIASREWSK